MFFPNKIIKEIKPQFIKKGSSIYSLKTIHLLIKKELIDNNLNFTKDIYILTKYNEHKNIIKSTPINDDILINNLKELIDFAISLTKLKNINKYKINIYSENLLIIENDNQLLSNKKKILYIKISEITSKKSKKNALNQTDIKNNENETSNNDNSTLNSNVKLYNKTSFTQLFFNKKKNSNFFSYINLLPSTKREFSNYQLYKTKNNSLDSYSFKKPELKTKSVSTNTTNIPYCKINQNYLNESINLSSILSNKPPTNYFPLRGQFHIFKSKKKSNSVILSSNILSKNECLNDLLNYEYDVEKKKNISFKNELSQRIKIMKKFFISDKLMNMKEKIIILKKKSNEFIDLLEKYKLFQNELKDILLNHLDEIITDFNLQFYNKFCDTLKYNPKFKENFPYKRCMKEFILYSYLNEYSFSNFSEIMVNLMNKCDINNKDFINYFDLLIKELKYLKKKQDKIYNFIFIEKSFNSMNISIIFFEICILCTNYFNPLQIKIADFILLVLNLDKNFFFINYKQFYEYYFYFKCNNLVSNYEKFILVKSILNNLEKKIIKKDYKLNLKIREIFGIDERLKSIIKGFDNYGKINNYMIINSIFLKVINYFT